MVKLTSPNGTIAYACPDPPPPPAPDPPPGGWVNVCDPERWADEKRMWYSLSDAERAAAWRKAQEPTS